MAYAPPRQQPTLSKPSAVALEVRADSDMALSLNPGSHGGARFAVSLPKSNHPRTIVLPLGGAPAGPAPLTLQAMGPANASMIIDRIALLP